MEQQNQLQAANLLIQYNKNATQKRDVIDARADKQTKFGTWSYANPYNALYEKFSRDKNFDVRMWQKAVQLGEQDQYLSFLAVNQGTDLGEKFYDTNYYDYETRMLELYKKMADTTNSEERFKEVYDANTDSFVKESIGNMSDYAYIQYQLDNAYKARDEEMTRQLEQWRKDNMHWTEKGANFLHGLTLEFGEGILQGVAGILDFVISVGTFGVIPYATQGFKGDYLDAFVNYFGEKSLTALERQYIRSELDEYERKNTILRDIDGNMTNLGIYTAGVANSIGAMVPSIIINAAVPGGGVLANMAFGAQIFSSNMYENANNALIAESPAAIKILNASVKTAIEQVIEVGLDKVLGGTVQNTLKGLGKGAAGITGKSATWIGAKYFAKSVLQEGFEEFLQDGSTALADTFFGLVWEGYGEHGVTWETLAQSFACGALSSLLMTSGNAAFRKVSKSVKQRQAQKYQTSTKYKEKYDKKYTKKYEKKNGVKPDTITGPKAPADYMVKNRKGELKKMNMFAEMAFSDIFNELNDNIKKLSEGKLNTKKNLDLAKSVYTTLSSFAAFFQGIDADTLKSMALLFNKMEQTAKTQITPSTNINIQKQNVRASVATQARSFSVQAAIDFSNMLEKNTKVATKAIEAAKKVDNTLTEAGVTQVLATVDKAGTLTGEIAVVDEALRGQIQNNYDKLREQYDWVFITDGHSAVAVDNMLFVSEAWLQNYQTSDIYGFLSQNSIIEKIITNKQLNSIVDEIVKFDEQFTNRQNLTKEQAVMDLLFNKSIYQAFLLSSTDSKNPNAIKYKDVLFRLPQMVTFLAKKGGTTLENNYLQKTVNMIKDTMREPMMKAIVNWNMDPQAIGADFVLTEADKQFINAHKSRQQTFANVASGDTAAAKRLLPSLSAKLNSETKALLERGLADNATNEDRTQAALLLQLLSTSERREKTVSLTNTYEQFMRNISRIESSFYTEGDIKKAFNDITDLMALIEDNRFLMSTFDTETPLLELLQDLESIGFKNVVPYNIEQHREYMSKISAENIKQAQRIIADILPRCKEAFDIAISQSKKVDVQNETVFVVPESVIDTNNISPVSTQQKADTINNFTTSYGYDPMQVNRFTTLDNLAITNDQRNKIMQEMNYFNTTNLVDFTCRKLEVMLGNDYAAFLINDENDRNSAKAAAEMKVSVEMFKNTFETWSQRLDKLADNTYTENNLLEAIEMKSMLFERYEPLLNMYISDMRAVYEKLKQLFAKKIINFETYKELRPSKEIIDFLHKDSISYSDAYELSTNMKSDMSDWLNKMTSHFADVNFASAGHIEIIQKIRKEDVLARQFLIKTETAMADTIAAKAKADTQGLNNLFNMFTQVEPYYASGTGLTLASEPVPLTAFLKEKSAINAKLLSGYSVCLGYLEENSGAYISKTKTIYLNINGNEQIDTLTHEINHLLQDVGGLPGGGSEIYNNNYLMHVQNNFSDVVSYFAKSNLSAPDAKIFSAGKLDLSTIKTLNRNQRSILTYIGYRLLQGELWAETKVGTPLAKGTIYDATYDVTSYSKPPLISPNATYISNSINDTFSNIIDAYAEASQTGYTRSPKVRNTAHSALSRGNTFDLVSDIMSPEIDAITGSMATIDDIIRDPQTYLSQEMLDKIGNDLSEGNVYFRLREYFEDQGKGVSIDRNQLQNYIFVDDTSFDDILKPDMKKRADGESTDIYNAYNGKEVPLMTFYNTVPLARYGLLSVKVMIDENVKNESVFNSDRQDGLIRVHATKTTTDAQIIDRINHEFRHILQKKNMLEIGFTPAFKVTNEMLTDLKEHAGDIFTNKQAIEYAKLNGAKTQQEIDTFIAQRFIYFLTGGEQNAFAWQSNLLNTKPVYVKYEGGKPTIFMPWYDGTVGRYKTEFLAMREAEDVTSAVDKKKKETVALPTVDKKKKEKAQLPRRISKETAQGNNLQYFYDRAKKRGESPQMDPDMQRFIIATTGNENRLPKSLIHAIKNGTLGQQTFYKWFRQVNASEINQFTFNLMNEYIFKNTVIESMEDLDMVIAKDAEFYWAAAIVLRREGLSAEALINENDVEHLMNVINSLEGTNLKEKINKQMVRFDEMTIADSKGQLKKVQLNTDVENRNYMRVLAMKYFDGTLAGAFYLGNTYRKVLALDALEQEKGKDSLDRTITADKDMNVADKLSAGDVRDVSDSKNIANDILALYNLERGEDTNYMLETLAKAKYDIEVEKYVSSIKNEKARKQVREWFYGDIELRDKILELEKKSNKTEKEVKLLKMMDTVNRYATKILDVVLEFQTKLSNMPHEILVDRFNRYMTSRMTGVAVENSVMSLTSEGRKNVYANTVANIKSYGKKISNLLNNAQIAFIDLPAEVQALFEERTEKTESGKTVTVYVLKDTTYKVGRGRAALSETTSETHGKQYAHKRNLLDERQTYKHDTTRIEKNAQLLKDTYTIIKQIMKDRRMNVSREIRAVERANARADRNVRDILNARTEARAAEKKLRETEFTVKKRRRTNDTPNHFTLSTSTEIPSIMMQIYDTSFNDLANTAVQFASRDVDGKLFDKEKMSREEFDSRLQHEISNWDAFYEANRDILLNLTREDVLDILDYYRSGGVIMSLDGPVNKLVAVEIFTLGYLVDAMRNNMNTWNFSAEDIAAVESLYEKKASAYGSGLNAVGQMKEVIHPYKKIQQHMLEEFNITDDQLAPFIASIETLQNTTDPTEYKERVKDVFAEIEKIERQIILNDNHADKELRFRKKGLGKRWLEKLQAFRYTAMLSSPATWMRNTVSNIALYTLNNISDQLGKLVLPKKGYREGQWDLTNTQVSEEVKQFFEDYVKEQAGKGGLLYQLYDDASKYDERYKRSTKNGQATFKVKDDIYVTLITNAIQQKFAANHKFDNVVMNRWARFVQKMISDKAFIRKVTNKYFNKILTIESQVGNVDLTKGLSTEVLNLFAEAVILAQADYMHKPSVIGDMLASLYDKHPLAYNAIKIWQPFLNSSFNWFQEFLKYSPIGLINACIKMATLEKQIAKAEARRTQGKIAMDSRATEYFIRRDIGKGIVGFVLLGLGLLLGSLGILRIEDDDDEFYMYAGDVKINISDIFGTSSIMIGASLSQFWANDNATAGDIAVTVLEYLFEGFFLKDFLDRHKYDDNMYEALLTETESFLSSFVPQVVQLTIRATNNRKIKYSSGMKGMWERWLNRFVPTQPFGQTVINVYTGEPESKYVLPFIGEFLKSGILGPKFVWSKISEQEEFARTYGVNKQELTGEITINGVKHNMDKNAVNKKYGELNQSTLLSLQTKYHKVKMPDGSYKTLPWDRLTDDQKKSVIERQFNKNASIAKIYVWTQEMGNKYYASDDMWQELRAVSITKNVYKGDKGFVE